MDLNIVIVVLAVLVVLGVLGVNARLSVQASRLDRLARIEGKLDALLGQLDVKVLTLGVRVPPNVREALDRGETIEAIKRLYGHRAGPEGGQGPDRRGAAPALGGRRPARPARPPASRPRREPAGRPGW